LSDKDNKKMGYSLPNSIDDVGLASTTTGNGTSTTAFTFVSPVKGRLLRVGSTGVSGTIAGGATCAVTVQPAGGTASADLAAGQFLTANGNNLTTAPVATAFEFSGLTDGVYLNSGDIVRVTPAAGTGSGTYYTWVQIRTTGDAMNQHKLAPRAIVYQAQVTGGTAAVTSPTFSAQTRYVRIGASGGAVTDRVNYIISQTGTSTVATAFATLASGNYEFVGVSPGQQAVVHPTAAAVVVTITEGE
jgi:hypothetical protein